MDCNKEEARKAMQIAEMKVALSDFTGAKRLALKAQSLYPQLDGLPQFLATLNVRISAVKGKNGEVDCCKVLGVEPSADENTVQKKFRKMALVLHPDKNKFVGAEEAFKILSDAKDNYFKQKKELRSAEAPDVKSDVGVPDLNVEVPDVRSVPPTKNHFFRDFFNTRDEGSATPTMPDGQSSVPTTQYGFQDFFRGNSNTRDDPTNPYATPTMRDGKSTMPTAEDVLQDIFGRNLNTRDQRSATPTNPFGTPMPSADPTMPDGKSSTHTTQSGFQDFLRSKKSTRDERSATPTRTTRPYTSRTKTMSSYPQKGRKHTFWTICSCCRRYFEYLRRFVNHKLQCHYCQMHFIAYKIPAPKNASKSMPYDQEKLGQPTMPSNACDPGRTHAAATDAGSSGFSGVDKPMFAPGRTHAAATDVRSSGISGVFYNSETDDKENCGVHAEAAGNSGTGQEFRPVLPYTWETNSETFFNTAALISCVQNFPKSRGPVVGILKGCTGLSGAMISEIYAILKAPDDASLLCLIPVEPPLIHCSNVCPVILAVMIFYYAVGKYLPTVLIRLGYGGSLGNFASCSFRAAWLKEFEALL